MSERRMSDTNTLMNWIRDTQGRILRAMKDTRITAEERTYLMGQSSILEAFWAEVVAASEYIVAPDPSDVS